MQQFLINISRRSRETRIVHISYSPITKLIFLFDNMLLVSNAKWWYIKVHAKHKIFVGGHL